MKSQRLWDVIVAGAGPGGSASAALLAKKGFRVLVLEKDEFPRFHIGESLLPASELVQSELGVDIDPEVFLFKRGAQFLCEASGRHKAFDFAEALPGPQRYAWQVERARFDTLLRDRALAFGAEVRHGVRVEEVSTSEEGVEVSSSAGRERARYFIDASGQGRLLASKMRSVEAFRDFGKAALFTHFHALSDEAWGEIAPHHDVRILMIPEGWAWVIPLAGKRLSVGVVSQRQGIQREDLDRFLAQSTLLQRLTRGAERGETRCIGNFSYRNARPFGPRYACVGDAACFIDPVFSSGVSLALQGASQIGRALAEALEKGEEANPRLMAGIEGRLEQGYATFAALVYRFYNTRFVDNMIFGAPDDGEYRAGVVSVLAGDVYRNDNTFADMLLRSRRRPDANARGATALQSMAG